MFYQDNDEALWENKKTFGVTSEEIIEDLLSFLSKPVKQKDILIDYMEARGMALDILRLRKRE